MNNKNNEKSFWDKKYTSISSLLVLAVAIFGPTYWINFHEIPDLKKQISELSIESKYIEITEKEEKLFQRRFENIENKYIDIIASKDTINFWMTLLLFIFTIGIGGTWWQKNRMVEYAEGEMERIEKIVKEKEKELRDFEINYNKNIEAYKKRAEEDVKLIGAKYRKLKNEYENVKSDHQKLHESVSSTHQILSDLKLETKPQLSFEAGDDFFQRGNEYFKIGEYEEAIKQYDKALEIDKKDTSSLHNKGAALAEFERYEEAIELFDRVLEINENHTSSLYNKGNVLYKLEKYKEAIEQYDKVLTIDENHMSSLYNKACANSLLNNKKKSFQNLHKIFELNYFEDKGKRENFYKDEDFDNIRKTKEFKDFVQNVKDKYGD